MKKILFSLLIMMASSLYADSKLTALTQDTTAQAGDLLYKVDNPGGTPVSRSITAANLLASLLVSTNIWSGGNTYNSSTTFTSTVSVTNVSSFALGQTTLVDTNTIFQVGTSTVMAYNNSTGHLEFHASTTPTLSSCGTGPSIASNSSDMTGTFTMGSLTVGCTLTFSNMWKNTPQCFGNDETGVNAVKFVPTKTNVIVTTAGSGGDTVDYLCIGDQ